MTFSKHFLLILSICSVTQMRYMPTCSLGREKLRSSFRLDVWPHVFDLTWVEAGLLQLLLQPSHGLVVVPRWPTPSWCLPSPSWQEHCKISGFSLCSEWQRFVLKTSWACRLHTCSCWGDHVVVPHLRKASIGSQRAADSCYVCSTCEDELWKSGLLALSFQLSIF